MFSNVIITGIVTSLIAYSFSSIAFVAADSINPGVYSKDSAPYGIPMVNGWQNGGIGHRQ